LPPVSYPGYRKALSEIEAWYVCGKSENERAQIVHTAHVFAQNCKDGRAVFEGRTYKVCCIVERGLIIFDNRVEL